MNDKNPHPSISLLDLAGTFVRLPFAIIFWPPMVLSSGLRWLLEQADDALSSFESWAQDLINALGTATKPRMWGRYKQLVRENENLSTQLAASCDIINHYREQNNRSNPGFRETQAEAEIKH